MPDILKYIRNEDEAAGDPHGYLMELDAWSEREAERLAKGEGIAMTSDHWDVVNFLRRHYAEFGPTRFARETAKLLEDRFAAKGGRKYLYRLFPKGPVNQANRIAGLPIPAHSTDPSFGTAQ